MNDNMIKILINNRDYSDYDFIDPDTNNTLSNDSYNFIDPIELKLFTKDYLDINDNSVKVHHSYPSPPLKGRSLSWAKTNLS